MIIIAYKPGRLGNSLFLFAMFISFGLKYNVKVLNPSFNEYAHLFPALKKYPGFPTSHLTSGRIHTYLYILSNYLVRFFNKLKIKLFVSMLGEDEKFDMDRPENIAILTKKIIFVFGWLYRTRLTEVYRKELIEIFKPGKDYTDNVDLLIIKARQGVDLLIGVHIRHEDYKNFMGGKYYYTFDQYLLFMSQTRKVFEDKKVRFLVCTNGSIDPLMFKDLDVISGNNHFLEDMYSFSKCDFIVGPPSTYTMWASFYGAVPLYQIEDAGHDIRLSDFKMVKG